MMKIKNDGHRRLRLGMVTLNPGQSAEVPDDEGSIILRKFADITDITPKLKYKPSPKKKEKKEEDINLDLNFEVKDNGIE